MEIKKNKIIWISWEKHRRTIEISNALNCKLFIIKRTKKNFIGYYFLSIKTLKILYKTNPKVLIVQNPSVILNVLTGLLKIFFRYKLIVDAHNAAIVDKDFDKLPKPIYKMAQALANNIIVSNKELLNYIKKSYKVFVLPDKIPQLNNKRCIKKSNNMYNIIYICSFNKDEPFQNVIAAAKLLINNNVHFYITGSYNNKILLDDIPKNVTLTGFLSDEKYIELISSMDLGIVLTKRDHCLTCGAYELISLNIPMVLSSKSAIKDYFSFGAVYCDNTKEDIAEKVIFACNKLEDFKEQIKNKKYIMEKKWESNFKIISYNILKKANACRQSKFIDSSKI